MKLHFFPPYRKESAMTITEVMVSLGIASIVGLIAATMLSRQNETAEELKATLAMQAIAKSIEAALTRPEVVRASALYAPYIPHKAHNGNHLLFNCISKPDPKNQASKSPCTTTNPEAPQEFDLILPIKGSITKEAVLKNTLAGGEFPMLYTLQGIKDCFTGGHTLKDEDKTVRIAQHNPVDPSCQFSARVKFWASCPALNNALPATTSETVPLDKAQEVKTALPSLSLPASCQTAATINIRYEIQHIVPSSIQSKKFNKVLPAIPPQSIIKGNPGFNAIAISVSTLGDLSSANLACPRNESITKIVDGKPVCECLKPFRKVKLGNISVCEPLSKRCAANERYRGFKDDGTPICQPVSCELANSNQGCRLGGWMEKFNVLPDYPNSPLTTGCRGQMCWVGKNGGECKSTIYCDTYMYCCYEIDKKYL